MHRYRDKACQHPGRHVTGSAPVAVRRLLAPLRTDGPGGTAPAARGPGPGTRRRHPGAAGPAPLRELADGRLRDPQRRRARRRHRTARRRARPGRCRTGGTGRRHGRPDHDRRHDAGRGRRRRSDRTGRARFLPAPGRARHGPPAGRRRRERSCATPAATSAPASWPSARGPSSAPASWDCWRRWAITEVPVHRALRVLLVTTGDEVVEPGSPLGPGKIFDSNGTLLESSMRQAGLQVTRTGISTDRPDELAALAAPARRGRGPDRHHRRRQQGCLRGGPAGDGGPRRRLRRRGDAAGRPAGDRHLRRRPGAGVPGEPGELPRVL